MQVRTALQKNVGGVQAVAIDMKPEAMEGAWGVGARESCLADIGADFYCIGLEGIVWDRFRVPVAMAAILAKDEGGWGSSKTRPDSCFQRSRHAHKQPAE